jgi:hypothetical protein
VIVDEKHPLTTAAVAALLGVPESYVGELGRRGKLAP